MVATAAPARLASDGALGRRVEKVVTGATDRHLHSGVETVSAYTSRATGKHDYAHNKQGKESGAELGAGPRAAAKGTSGECRAGDADAAKNRHQKCGGGEAAK